MQRYKSESEKIVDSYRLRSGADYTLFGVYDENYEYRTIVVSSGSLPGGDILDSQSSSVDQPGFQEVLETSQEGQVFYSLVKDLPEGTLKIALENSGAVQMVTAPVFDENNYLIGYFGASYSRNISSSLIVNYANTASSELTRLSRIF